MAGFPLRPLRLERFFMKHKVKNIHFVGMAGMSSEQGPRKAGMGTSANATGCRLSHRQEAQNETQS